MDMNELETQIREFLRTELGVEDREVRTDTELVTSGLLDSAGLVRLAALLEEVTGITIPDRDIKADNFDTLARIAAYLQSRRAD